MSGCFDPLHCRARSHGTRLRALVPRDECTCGNGKRCSCAWDDVRLGFRSDVFDFWVVPPCHPAFDEAAGGNAALTESLRVYPNSTDDTYLASQMLRRTNPWLASWFASWSEHGARILYEDVDDGNATHVFCYPF